MPYEDHTNLSYSRLLLDGSERVTEEPVHTQSQAQTNQSNVSVRFTRSSDTGTSQQGRADSFIADEDGDDLFLVSDADNYRHEATTFTSKRVNTSCLILVVAGSIIALVVVVVALLLTVKSPPPGYLDNCQPSLEALHQWLNESQQIIRGYVVEEEEILHCHDFTPVPHQVLQNILETYPSISAECDPEKIFSEESEREEEPQDDSAFIKLFMQSLLDCLSKPNVTRYTEEFEGTTTVTNYQTTSEVSGEISEYSYSRSSIMTVNVSQRPSVLDDIEGLTVLDGKVYVLMYRKPITLYDLESLVVRPYMNITSFTKGITSSSLHKALYVSDWLHDTIIRVNLTDKTTKTWKLIKNYAPHGLSMTSKNNVLVTVEVSEGSKESRILEYTDEGQLIRDIELDRSIKDPHQTLELSTDRFIISHGDYSARLHRVCLINSRGEIAKCFGGEEGRGEGQLNGPRSVALDKKRNLVLVADYYNDRIVMLSYSLNYLGQISQRISNPFGIHYDIDSDLLIIGGQFKAQLTIISPNRTQIAG